MDSDFSYILHIVFKVLWWCTWLLPLTSLGILSVRLYPLAFLSSLTFQLLPIQFHRIILPPASWNICIVPNDLFYFHPEAILFTAIYAQAMTAMHDIVSAIFFWFSCCYIFHLNYRRVSSLSFWWSAMYTLSERTSCVRPFSFYFTNFNSPSHVPWLFSRFHTSGCFCSFTFLVYSLPLYSYTVPFWHMLFSLSRIHYSHWKLSSIITLSWQSLDHLSWFLPRSSLLLLTIHLFPHTQQTTTAAAVADAGLVPYWRLSSRAHTVFSVHGVLSWWFSMPPNLVGEAPWKNIRSS